MVNVFISYSHADEKLVEEFLKKTHPLHSGNDPICNIWRDRLMMSGDSISVSIDSKIKDTDLAIIFLSEDFMASCSCQDEVAKFNHLKEERGLKILSLIVDWCLWREDSRLSDDLALTIDGKPYILYVEKHRQRDFWNEVITNFKGAVSKYRSEHPEIIRVPLNGKKAKFVVEFERNTDIELYIERLSTQIRNVHRELVANHFNGSSNDMIVYELQGTSEELYDILQYISLSGGEKYISNIIYISELDKLEKEDLTIEEALDYLRN